jgi:hypothetical protein
MIELNELILLALDDIISDEQIAVLNEKLVSDPKAVSNYIEFMDIYTEMCPFGRVDVSDLLHEKRVNIDKEELFLEELAEYEKNGRAVKVERVEKKVERVLTAEEREAKIRAFIEEERAAEAEERRLEQEALRKIRQRELRRRHRIQRAHRVAAKVRRYATMGAMAAMLMVIGYLVYAIMQPAPVARLTDAAGVQWSDSDLPTYLDASLRPGRMELIEGFAEITFNKGARIILEAPAEIKLESTSRAFVQAGRIAAEVPPQAQNFVINTPSASMVDLGTEFGVQVKEDGTSDLHVFKGKVALVAGPIGKKANGFNGNNGAREQIVRTGQARRVLAGSSKIQDIRFSETAFLRNVPSPYELAVHQSKPIAYWRFSRDQKQIGDALQYAGNAETAVTGPALGDGKANDALKLDGEDSYVLVKDKGGDWTQTGFSLVLWVRPDTAARQNIIVSADEDGPGSNYSRQLFMDSRGKFSFWILVGEPDLPEDYYPVTLTSSTVTQPGRWYHVAVTVAANGDIGLFINGSEENILSLDDGQVLDFKPERNRIYIGSTACGELDDREPMDSFEGGLDEIARYNRALSAREIRQLYLSVKK